MAKQMTRVAILIAATCINAPALAETPIWGIQVAQLEFRGQDDESIAAWDFDALYGTDELKLVWRGEAEYAVRENGFETLENQIRLQTPVSDFFDAVLGFRADTPDGPDRYSAVLGLHGLAPQWLEVDLDLFVSDKPFARLEVDYEALITNRLILTPGIEVELPLADDREIGHGAFAPKMEAGARLSFDLIDRLVSPYVGVHYERAFGETGDLAKREGDDRDAFFAVIGTRIVF